MFRRLSPMMTMRRHPMVHQRKLDRKLVNLSTDEDTALVDKKMLEIQVIMCAQYPDMKNLHPGVISINMIEELRQRFDTPSREPGDETEEAVELKFLHTEGNAKQAALVFMRMADAHATLAFNESSLEIVRCAARQMFVSRDKDSKGIEAEMQSYAVRAIAGGLYEVTAPGFEEMHLTGKEVLDLATLFQAAGVPLVGAGVLRRTIISSGEPLFQRNVTKIARGAALAVLKPACNADRWPLLEDHILEVPIQVHVCSKVDVLHDLVDKDNNIVRRGRAVATSAVRDGQQLYIKAGAWSPGGELGREMSRFFNTEGQVLPDLAAVLDSRLGRLVQDTVSYDIKPLSKKRAREEEARSGSGSDGIVQAPNDVEEEDPENINGQPFGPHILKAVLNCLPGIPAGKHKWLLRRLLVQLAGYLEIKELLWGAADVKLLDKYWRTGRAFDLRVTMSGVETRVLIKSSNGNTVQKATDKEKKEAMMHTPTVMMQVMGAGTNNMRYKLVQMS